MNRWIVLTIPSGCSVYAGFSERNLEMFDDLDTCVRNSDGTFTDAVDKRMEKKVEVVACNQLVQPETEAAKYRRWWLESNEELNKLRVEVSILKGKVNG